MKKLILGLVAFMVAMSANAQCDWSGVKVKQQTFRNYYKFYADGLDSDSCTDFFWMFTYKNAKGQLITDTFGYSQNIVDFYLNLKGTSKLRLHAVNRCDKCDTTWTWYLEQAIFLNANWGYGEKTCKNYVFEASKLSNQKEECVQIYWYVYDYQGNEVGYDSGYRLEFTFPWEGQFDVYCQWWNHCLNQDTFYGKTIDVYCDSSTMGLTAITPSARGMARPNPTSCEFYITNTRGIHEYMIINPAGTIIAVGHTDPFEEVRIETCLWPNGVYYLLVEGLGRELIMIQH